MSLRKPSFVVGQIWALRSGNRVEIVAIERADGWTRIDYRYLVQYDELRERRGHCHLASARSWKFIAYRKTMPRAEWVEA